MDTADIIFRAALVGIGGTIVLDLYALLMQCMFGVPAGNWKMVGRWLGHMSKCEFVQTNIEQVEPVPAEHALGWTLHYVIGIAYGLLLVAIWGAGWLRQPGIAEPLILALALLVVPYLVMLPGIGMGMSQSRTPTPNVTRLKSVIGHSMFGTACI